jgi:TonB-dependent receptor
MMLNLDVLYSKLDIQFDRYTNNMLVRGTSATTNTPTGFGWITPRNFTVDDNNTVVSGTLDGAKFWSENRVFENNGDFRYVGLGSDWLINDDMQLDWKLSHGTSDWTLRHTTLLFLSAPSTTTLNIQDGLPVITPGIDLADPNNWAANQLRVQPRQREEENDNLLMNFRLGSDQNNVRTGLAYNKFSRDRRTYNWSNNSEILQKVGGFAANTPISSLNVASLSTQVPVNFGEYFDSSPGYTRWLVADLDALGQMLPYDKLDALAPFDPTGSGNIEEKNYALYLETNLTASVLERDMRINAGLRAIRTNQSLGGFLRNGASTTDFTTTEFRSDYQAYLPSFNVAVDLTDQLIGRFAASRSMTRASPSDLEPLTNIATGTAAVTQGNPNLDPYFSDQFDLGAEWYFSKGSVVAGNVFFKDISGFIELFTRRAPFRETGIPLETLDPSILAGLPNGLDTIVDFTSRRNSQDRVQIKGAELLYQQPLDMLLRGFGINANYTRLQSSGDRPVTGLAKNNFNIVTYFERDPYNVRLSYNYRSDYVECSSRNNCQDNQPDSVFREAAGYLDLSTSYGFEALGQKLAVSFEALNILDEEEHSYFGSPERIGALNVPRRQFLLGLRGSF